ncbi:IclR family transcriptional regulator (plasmid) [Halorarum halophilum]|uniref:IclR family transcriptional regulator n=1 Tax=Halorarum halophilum TaxID=2743090 RepID=A0A7D5KID1_9EURY|nr:IclR family transcriptional regulator [Halobaculum halophilum]QLG29916.1 IclR family transcriptional regulator [Halobaculum halophilum]
MTNYDVPKRRIKTTDTAFNILEVLTRLDGATVAEVAAQLDIAPSTVHDHLATLRWRGYVVQEGAEYHVGLLFLKLGMAARNRYAIVRPGEQAIAHLARETSTMVQLLAEENGRAIVLCRVVGEGAPSRNDVLGRVLPVHCSAAGKAIVASYSDDRVAAILDRHGLPKLTENTITDREEFFAELKRVRENGYSLNDGESVSGVRSIGRSIIVNDRVVAAATLTGSKHAMSDERIESTLSEQLLRTVNEIEMSITDMGDSRTDMGNSSVL